MTAEIRANWALGISIAALCWAIFRDAFGHLIDRGRLRVGEPYCIVDDPQESVNKLFAPLTNIGHRPIRLTEVETVKSKGWFRSESLGSIWGDDWPKELKESERFEYELDLDWVIASEIDKLIFHDHFGRQWSVSISGLRKEMSKTSRLRDAKNKR